MAQITASFPQSAPTIGKQRWMIGAALIALALLIGGAAYFWFAGGTGQPSSTLSAPSLALEPGDSRTLFHITPDESEARFLIDEVLLGNPKTVVGITDQVAGDLLIDFDQPAQSQLGTIRINVRTLATDSEIRNRALRGQILQAENPAYEFAEFAPTALVGLPEKLTIGEPVTFQIEGNLTVHGVTRPVTFDATVVVASEARLEASARATVQHDDFGMSIPEAPGVANVSPDVRLEIDLVALAA